MPKGFTKATLPEIGSKVMVLDFEFVKNKYGIDDNQTCCFKITSDSSLNTRDIYTVMSIDTDGDVWISLFNLDDDTVVDPRQLVRA
jgi:hypothetical protein